MTNAELRQLDAEADSHQADADARSARLAFAAARSYTRNTGDPLAAAEGDLLGEALGLLERLIASHDHNADRTHHPVTEAHIDAIFAARALLALRGGQETKSRKFKRWP